MIEEKESNVEITTGEIDSSYNLDKEPASDISNTDLPAAQKTDDWTDVEKTQRKQCMKLNFPHEITSNENNVLYF